MHGGYLDNGDGGNQDQEARTCLLTTINLTVDANGTEEDRKSRTKSCVDQAEAYCIGITGGIPMRFVLAALCSFGCVVVYTTRVSISIALVCMVNQTAVAERSWKRHNGALNSTTSPSNTDFNCPSQIIRNQTTGDGNAGSVSEDGLFVWEEELQGVVLSSFFWGYILTQIPAGILADKIGGKWILGVSLMVTSLLTISVPFAARASVYLVILARFLCGLAQGVTFPTINSIVANWFPQQERSILMNLATIGCSIGTIVTFPVSAYLCKYSASGWEDIFYVFGGIGLMWFCMWASFMRNKPADHPRISSEERIYIERNTKCNRNRNSVRIRFRTLFTSPPFLSLCVVSFTGGFKFFMLLTELPTYVKVVLDFDLAENGLINVMPYLISMPTAVLASLAADYIKNTGRFRVTSVRKCFAFFGSATSAAGLISIPFAGCNRHLVLVLLWVSMGIDALNAGGLDTNVVDMAPNIAGTITGISNSFAAAGGILAPYVVGVLTQNNNTKRGWDAAFYLSSTISLIGLTVFMIFGSSETQPWNESVDELDDADKPLDDRQQTD